mgnify:CR=1 FL=1
MDFLKKNVTWIALAALGISVYLYWQMNKTEDTDKTGTGKTGFTGKLSTDNPLNR